MDNQDNTQINNTMENAQPNQPVESKPVSNTPPKTDNKLLLYLAGAAIVLVLILAAVFLSGFLGNSNKKEDIVQQSQPTTAPTTGVSQEPITNQQDVVNALQQVENANPDAVGAGLDQNTADASSFSQ